MKYRKKPVIVEAWQVSSKPNPKWVQDAIDSELIFEHQNHIGYYYSIANDHCVESFLQCHHGDWIIKGVRGEFYPCKDDIFRETYDPVD